MLPGNGHSPPSNTSSLRRKANHVRLQMRGANVSKVVIMSCNEVVTSDTEQIGVLEVRARIQTFNNYENCLSPSTELKSIY